LFFYQCLDPAWNDTLVLRAVEIAVFEKKIIEDCRLDEESCIKITPIQNATKVVYEITDLGLSNLTFFVPKQFENDTSAKMTSAISYKFDLVVICHIENTFSNLLLIYNNVYLNGTMPNPEGNLTADPGMKSLTNVTLTTWNSAAKNVWDTFKANSLAIVPDSKFILVSLDGYGVIVYHTGRNQIVYTLNLTEGMSSFKV